MKNIILILSLLVFISGAVAQTPPVTETPVPVATANQPSAQEIKDAKEVLQKLTQEGNRPVGTPEQGQQKTVADAMDKGLDILSGYVTTLEGVVSKYAPEVWRIMIRQQYAEAIGYTAFWAFMLLSLWVAYNVLRKYFGVTKGEAIFLPRDGESRSYSYSAEYWARAWIVGILPIVVGIPFTICFLYTLTQAVMVFINPEYYALKDIIHLLK